MHHLRGALQTSPDYLFSVGWISNLLTAKKSIRGQAKEGPEKNHQYKKRKLTDTESPTKKKDKKAGKIHNCR